MSADNGIYIAEFPTEDGKVVYRVAYAQAIDNCFLRSYERELEDAYRVSYFADTPIFTDKTEAILYAHSKSDEFLSEPYADGFYPILEYGVSMLYMDRPLLDMTKEQANSRIEEYYRQVQKHA